MWIKHRKDSEAHQLMKFLSVQGLIFPSKVEDKILQSVLPIAKMQHIICIGLFNLCSQHRVYLGGWLIGFLCIL